ncbi:hypothetical protein PSEEN2999 [Pseudomonas entomophila L48]|uniref:Uncharacterized protein n=1 Tax=Pseudomonas entomophila (strain L48) TaxID=384676 RepID=Q1I9A8_PSEE4|nr:hypothetical protein PSEEN2999 [Pseudomonas entomophila L48]
MSKRLGSISVSEWGTITIRAIAETLEYQDDGSFVVIMTLRFCCHIDFHRGH